MMGNRVTNCDHCGAAFSGDYEGIPWEAKKIDGGFVAHSRNRCRHVLRDKLFKAQVAVARFIVAQDALLLKSWRDFLVHGCGLVDDGANVVVPTRGKTAVPK